MDGHKEIAEQLSNNELLIMAIPATILGIVGWLGHFLSLNGRFPKLAELVGGVLISGFVSWAAYTILHSTGMDSSVAGVMGAITGSMGKEGLSYLWQNYITKEKGPDA
jgi:hypothetical protein